MKILITSGGTSEKIDQVRSITNHSTGQLGKQVAEQFLAAGDHVTLVTTAQAVRPAAHPHLTIVIIEDVADLLEKLETLVKRHDVLVHSMAVSDYTPIYMAGYEEVAASQNLAEFLDKRNSESKISSDADYQLLFLKKTPKIISKVKGWNPSIRLIGFKLLVGAAKQELAAAARASLICNQAEVIIANDLTEIKGRRHHAYFISEKSEQEADSKEEIAQLILQHIYEGEGND